MMKLKAKRFDAERSEAVMLPLQRYVCLSELIEWIGRFDVEIPRDVEQTISEFGLRWEESLTPQARGRSMLFPPEPKLANLYRRGLATALLFRELSERQGKEPEPIWRNLLITGDAVRLRADEHNRAWSALERIALEARQVFWSTLNGERPFDPAISARYPMATSRGEREWFDALVFETKEIFALLYPELIVFDAGNALTDVSNGALQGTLSAAPQARVVQPGKERRNALTGVIEEAIKRAGGSHSAPEVWPRLKELALEGTPPFTGAFDDGAPMYAREVPDKENRWVVSLSYNRLESRLQRMKKKLVDQTAERGGGGHE